MLETYREMERRCLAAVMKDHPYEGSIRERFCHFAHRLVRHFIRFPEEFLFAEQFLSSPYRNSNPSSLSDDGQGSIKQFFREGTEQQLFKQMPPALLLALVRGPLIQVIQANAAGFLHLDDDRISQCVEACWDAVSVSKTG